MKKMLEEAVQGAVWTASARRAPRRRGRGRGKKGRPQTTLDSFSQQEQARRSSMGALRESDS
ncbi:MAG: hypothetical protein IPJ34_33875 [Myxococcales bacterium]|nr:hypothetical protein [Myxococcales bacterium]